MLNVNFVLTHAGQVGTTDDCGATVCTQEYNPLCGTNGQTHSNPCTFQAAQCGDVTLQVAYEGECKGKWLGVWRGWGRVIGWVKSLECSVVGLSCITILFLCRNK